MNRINVFGIEPGAYVDEKDFKVVVLDVVTHQYNPVVGLEEALPTPSVLVRNAVELKEHIRYLYPIEIFKAKFKPI